MMDGRMGGWIKGAAIDKERKKEYTWRAHTQEGSAHECLLRDREGFSN